MFQHAFDIEVAALESPDDIRMNRKIKHYGMPSDSNNDSMIERQEYSPDLMKPQQLMGLKSQINRFKNAAGSAT